MGLAWEKQLSVGNAVIDSDHMNLIGIVNDAEVAIRERDCPVLAQAFESLERWLLIHSANEEKIAQAIGFDFSGHRLAQQYSLKELQYLRDELLSKRGIWSGSASEHYTRSLVNWMTEHIARIDMPMRPMLQKADYKFWPGAKQGEANHVAGHTASLYLQLLNALAPCPA